jgi:phage major head subunit gpT-like protein
LTIIKDDMGRLLDAGVKTLFYKAYEAAPAQYEDIVTVVPSNTNSEDYSWLGALPTMREWTDERIPRGLIEHEFTITNKDWEVTIAVDRNVIEDDQYGQLKARISAMAEEARRHIDELVFELLASGFSSECYDGQYFFDAGHPDGSGGTQSNKGIDSLSATAYGAARAAMMKFTDDQGRVMGVVPDTIVVPPELEEMARHVLNSDFYPETGYEHIGNPWKGSARLIVSPYLVDADDWFLLCTARAVRPLVLQMRREVTFNALEGQSEGGFMRKRYLYGADARYNVGFGPWQFAYGSSVSGS